MKITITQFVLIFEFPDDQQPQPAKKPRKPRSLVEKMLHEMEYGREEDVWTEEEEVPHYGQVFSQ